MKNDLTLQKLKNSGFFDVFENFLKSSEVDIERETLLLRCVIVLLRSDVKILNELGYRICVLYGNKTGDYLPLYDISLNLGYFPIVNLIEEKAGSDWKSEDSFIHSFQNAFLDIFKNSKYTATFQQYDIKEQFKLSKGGGSYAVVAPTSYGKSELIEQAVGAEGSSCILVPTKALLAQTKKRLLKIMNNDSKYIVTHPEMPLPDNLDNLICILTQERLVRILQHHKDLAFDFVFVDEAHNLLCDNSRSRLLAVSIMMLQGRNEDTSIVYLTPFVKDIDNLAIDGVELNVKELRIDESVKTERLIYCDLEKGNEVYLYDQFMDKNIEIGKTSCNSYEEYVYSNAPGKSIIYFNRPKDAQYFSKSLASIMPKVKNDEISRAITYIKEYMHKDYDLLFCLERGVIYHHGSMPDNVKLYIESLYSKIPELRFVVTTSTLLEGVNIPAECLFVMDNRKGLRKLSPAQFKNLVGRACRFSEVFSKESGRLDLLEPKIFLVGSKFMRKGARVDRFFSETMKIDRKVKDQPENLLLENVEVSDEQKEEFRDYEEFVHNLDDGLLEDENLRTAETEFGKECFLNNIFEMDIFDVEQECQKELENLVAKGITLKEPLEIIQTIANIFLNKIKSKDEDQHRSLVRLAEIGAQNFYAMLLRWRVENTSVSEMVWMFIQYWKELIAIDEESYVYAGRWGDEVLDSFSERWVQVGKKTDVELVNLAIVRIKDEFDFLDNSIIKFIEVLQKFGVIDEGTYLGIKYGTSDSLKIQLVKSGMSISLIGSLLKSYKGHLDFSPDSDLVTLRKEGLESMKEDNVNGLLIHEASFHIRK